MIVAAALIVISVTISVVGLLKCGEGERRPIPADEDVIDEPYPSDPELDKEGATLPGKPFFIVHPPND